MFDVCVIEVYVNGITTDAMSQPEFDRYLAAPAAEACDAMQWWAANDHH